MREKLLVCAVILGSSLLGVSAWACPEPKVNKWDYEHVHCLQDGLALFKPRGQSYGYMDKYGDVVIRPQFEMGKGFREGLAAVKVNGRWGYIDTSGYFVIRPQFDFANDFYNGVAEVRRVGENRLIKIDRQGYEDGGVNPNAVYIAPVVRPMARPPEPDPNSAYYYPSVSERPRIVERPSVSERPTIQNSRDTSNTDYKSIPARSALHTAVVSSKSK